MEKSGLTIAPSARLKKDLAPGTRITARGEEWVVRECSYELELGAARVVRCEGVSGFLRGIQATFVDAFDHIEIVDPLDIKFVVDDSTKFRDSKLWIDTWARKVVPVDNSLAIGHRAVVDALPYQRVPAAMALDSSRNIRPRILIADAVGLGKTIEVGILLSELIKRGRGHRILVVVLKSMMMQFQKELWSRFAIALDALDGPRLEAISRSIPRSMNPLDQVSRAIISMDTLKTKNCRHWLENSRWDVVVIDECHNVARRGGSGSQRSLLAQKLAKISDSLILTSATPHDGTPASYASLLELLDPLLVVDPDKVTKDDLKPVTIQRYAKDVRLSNYRERREFRCFVQLDEVTLKILKSLVGRAFDAIGKNIEKKRDALFRTTLSKALMSSPEAFAATVRERLKKLTSGQRQGDERATDESYLQDILTLAESISVGQTAKYSQLVKILREDTRRSRVVIFTESRRTLSALLKALASDFDLRQPEEEDKFDKRAQIIGFHGGQSESDQQEILESFQTRDSKIKIMIATDVASEGINLHYFCSHLIHYDIPWSLITISQRNGRIDRYGQNNTPQIYYLIGDTQDPAAVRLCERRVVEILIDKAKYAEEALGNVGVSLALYDAERESAVLEEAIAVGDPLDQLFADTAPELSQTISPDIEARVLEPWRPYPVDNLKFVLEAARYLNFPATPMGTTGLKLSLEDDAPGARALQSSLEAVAKELGLHRTRAIDITSSHAEVNESIVRARAKMGQWATLGLGWEIHPTVEALGQMVESRFAKNEVRVLTLPNTVRQGFLGFMVYRALYDHTGHPIFCAMQMAMPEKLGWRYLEPKDGYDELGLTDTTINPEGDLAKADIKELHSHAKSLFEALTKQCQTEAAGAQRRRVTASHTEGERASVWYSQRKRYLEERYSHAVHARRLATELSNLNSLKERHRDFVDRYGRIEESNLYLRIVAAYWGVE